MAAAPRYKVYAPGGIYEAATKELDTAMAIIGGIGGEGWTVRAGHSPKDVIWREGVEEIPAGENFDRAAAIARSRIISGPHGGGVVKPVKGVNC